MSGYGHRFKVANYKEAKPFIPIGNKNIIQCVLDNLELSNSTNLFIIVRQDLCYEYSKEIQTLEDVYGARILIEHDKPEGAAVSVLRGINQIDQSYKSLPTIIKNSDDMILDSGWLKRAIRYWQNKDADGGIICFLSDEPRWSYAVVKKGLITKTVEKQVVSNFATFGGYYWKDMNKLELAIQDMIAANDRFNGEFYLCPSYTYLANRGGKIYPYIVNEICDIGTPATLEKYKKDIRCE